MPISETQLHNLRLGQPVKLTADMYGDTVAFNGKVASLGLGTGSAFALLPAQNASGNWIKIVQRVPVRITLDPRQLREHPLRLGMSMAVKVNVHDQSLPVLPAAAAAAGAGHRGLCQAIARRRRDDHRDRRKKPAGPQN